AHSRSLSVPSRDFTKRNSYSPNSFSSCSSMSSLSLVVESIFCISLYLLQNFFEGVHMLFRSYIVIPLTHVAVFIHDTSGPDDPFRFLAEHFHHPVYTEALSQLEIFIHKEVEVQTLLFNKILMFLLGIAAHPIDLYTKIIQEIHVIPEITCLGGAPGCIIFRIE